MEDSIPPQPRPPDQIDLVRPCSELNARKALYMVVGGMAVIHHGLVRATEGIDLLIEASQTNQSRVRAALETLPDKAAREMLPDDLDNFIVVRVADEIVVDLMLKTRGIGYDEAAPFTEIRIIDGVSIPFASAKLLLRMKQTYREKDELDRQFLERKIRDAP
jgi:hypothetical protein